MGTNPIAVDMVAARLLGYALEDVPYLALAVARGYYPASLDDIIIQGDLGSLDEIDEHAQRILPYDDEYTLSLIHISEPTRHTSQSRIPSSA